MGIRSDRAPTDAVIAFGQDFEADAHCTPIDLGLAAIDACPASVRYFDHAESGFKAFREREQNFLRRAMNRAPGGRARVVKDGVCPRRASSREKASKRNCAIGGGYCGAHDVGSKLSAVTVDKLRQSLVRAQLAPKFETNWTMGSRSTARRSQQTRPHTLYVLRRRNPMGSLTQEARAAEQANRVTAESDRERQARQVRPRILRQIGTVT